jgi:hypothetical protein
MSAADPARTAAASDGSGGSSRPTGSQPSPFACDLAALGPEQRRRHHALLDELRGTAEEVRELPDGWAARFAPEPATLLALAEFVTLERLCCPVFTLTIEAERERGPLWLRITGREGVKPFARAELGFVAG